MVPSQKPLNTVFALFLGVVLFAGAFKLCLGPVQRAYVVPYVRTSFGWPKKQRLSLPGQTPRQKYDTVKLHEWIKEEIYDGGAEVLVLPTVLGSVGLLGLLVVGIMADAKRRRRLFIEGERIRGTELISRKEWNNRRKGDGFALRVK